MFTKSQFEECLKNIDESLILDNESSCLINVKDSFDIALHYDEQTGYVLAFCKLGKIPQDKELKLAITKELLTANFLWRDTMDGTISILKDENIFVYQSVYLNDTLDDFEHFLKYMAAKCEIWINRYEVQLQMFAFELFDSEDNESFVLDDDEDNEDMNIYNASTFENDNNNQTFMLDA